MGLFDAFKKKNRLDYDLEDLEDLVYDDERQENELDDTNFENVTKKLDIEELFEGVKSASLNKELRAVFDNNSKKDNNSTKEQVSSNDSGKDSDNKTKGKKALTTSEKQRQVKLEEEKYDHLLNSVQANELIKKVDSISEKKKEQAKKNTNNSRVDIKIKPEGVEDNRFIRDTSNGYSTKIEEKTVVLPDVTKKPKKLETVNLDKFKQQDIEGFVKGQCDIMEEAAAHIEAAKNEYDCVTEYFLDIQKIEESPKAIQEQISFLAERVDSLSVDRRMYRNSEQKLSTTAYRRMEMFEDELPKGLKYVAEQESYYELVTHDMRALEGERLGLRLEAKALTKRQLRIRSMSILFIACLVTVFLAFIVLMIITNNDENLPAFISVTALAAAVALSMFAYLKYTERQVLVTEIKLNKATALLNKMKIKYVNAANTLDYEYNKYNVKSSYELGKKYDIYLEMKAEQQKMMRTTTNLNEAEEDLLKELRKLRLFDTRVWLSQVKALYNKHEMVEVRHNLNERRAKLRTQIEYNDGRIEEAKENIRRITKENPAYAETALKVVDLYEKKNQRR